PSSTRLLRPILAASIAPPPAANRPEEFGLERLLRHFPARSGNAVCLGVGSRADDSMELSADEMERRTVVGGIAGRERTALDEIVVNRATRGLAVIVRAMAAADPPKRVDRREAWAEGIAHARLEPAKRPSAEPGEHLAAPPLSGEEPVESPFAPDQKEVPR